MAVSLVAVELAEYVESPDARAGGPYRELDDDRDQRLRPLSQLATLIGRIGRPANPAGLGL